MPSRKSRKSRKILPRPTKGALEGYSTSQLASTRRAKLEKLVRKNGYASVIHDLNLVANYNKRTAPAAHKKMKADMAYLKKEYR